MYNNNIDIEWINEKMINKNAKLDIRGYKIYRVDAKTRKGLDIYITISNNVGRFIEIKLRLRKLNYNSKCACSFRKRM